MDTGQGMRTNHAGHHWYSLQVMLGVTCMLFAMPALFSILLGLNDRVFGDVLQTHAAFRLVFLVFFLSLFTAGGALLVHGLRHGTRPPSLLYRLTHPRLSWRRTWKRQVW